MGIFIRKIRTQAFSKFDFSFTFNFFHQNVIFLAISCNQSHLVIFWQVLKKESIRTVEVSKAAQKWYNFVRKYITTFWDFLEKKDYSVEKNSSYSSGSQNRRLDHFLKE